MIRDLDPTVQALLGTLFTWGVTALGAAVVFVAVIEVCTAAATTAACLQSKLKPEPTPISARVLMPAWALRRG